MRGSRHGNFHFYGNGFIQLKRRGRLLLRVRDLETLCFLALRRSLYEKKPLDYYWQEYNDAIQEVIDDNLAKCRSARRARWDKSVSEE
jgi:hypothetical protein